MESQKPEDSNKSPFYWIWDLLDRLNYSHGGNKNTFEALLDQISKQIELTANVQVQSLLGYRNNLLTLVGGLVALIGLLINNGLTKPELSFRFGFTALLLSVGFAIVQAIVVASYDIANLQTSLQEAMKFKGAIAKHLSKVKKVEFSSMSKAEFETEVQEYRTYLNKSKKSWTTRFSRVIAFLLNASLLVSMIGLAVYYGSSVWK